MGTQKRSDTALIGTAGVHYVGCELSRRQLIALPTIRNTAGYDMIAATSNGKRHANIQVKTSGNTRVRFWPVAREIRNIRRGPDDYYVFLGGLERGEEVQAYLLKVKDVVKEIQHHYKNRLKRGKRFPYCLYLREEKRETWARAWKSWTLK